MKETCENCRYCHAVVTEQKNLPTELWRSMYFCHRYPPMFKISGSHGYVNSTPEFPLMEADDWCGEWKSKDKQEKE